MIYILEINRIYNEDCLDGIKKLENESVDCIITDPPYNLSKKNNFHTMKGRHGIDFGEWDKEFDLICWLETALPKVKTGGNIIIFNDWKNMTKFVDFFNQNDCLVKEMIQWRKTNPMPRNRDRLYVTSCEFAIWATKGKGWTFNRQVDTYENTVFTYPLVSSKERIHPTQKPVELISDLIKIHTNENDLVLDPFMGSNTTAIACMNTNRNFIGFEKDFEIYNTGQNRLNSYNTYSRKMA